MSVLVGIVSKNRATVLPQAIDSALQQKGVSVRVAVYDDHSSDNTPTLASRYPTVLWEFGNTSRGYVFARNKFMREATQDYFCSLDDDSWFMQQDSLAIGVSYLEAHPDVAAVAYDILSPDRPNVAPVREPFEVNTFIGCGHVVRLSAAREVGLYDPFPSYYGGEEKDLCLRLIDRGFKIMKLPGVHVWHEKTMIARDLIAQHRSGVCNDLVFIWRRTPFILLLLLVPIRIWKHRRFAKRYSNGELMGAYRSAVVDFWHVVRAGQLVRRPVSWRSLRKWQRMPGQ